MEHPNVSTSPPETKDLLLCIFETCNDVRVEGGCLAGWNHSNGCQLCLDKACVCAHARERKEWEKMTALFARQRGFLKTTSLSSGFTLPPLQPKKALCSHVCGQYAERRLKADLLLRLTYNYDLRRLPQLSLHTKHQALYNYYWMTFWILIRVWFVVSEVYIRAAFPWGVHAHIKQYYSF